MLYSKALRALGAIRLEISKWGLRWLGAMVMLFAGTYSIALSWEQDWCTVAVALIAAGPMLMSCGWLANFFQPLSKLGWTLILYGFNFACGFPLAFFAPTNMYFGGWDSNGALLTCCFLAVALNSWQTLYHIDQTFRLRRIWHSGKKMQLLIAQAVINGAFCQYNQEGLLVHLDYPQDCNSPH